MFRILELSDACSRVSVEHRQIVVWGEDEAADPLHSSPCEDLLAVILDGRRTHLTTSTLRALMRAGPAVMVSDDHHMPIGLMVSMEGYSEAARRIRLQAAQSLPATKRIWRDLVVAKICAQAANLEPLSAGEVQVRAIAATVHSGDPENREAQAARAYWSVFWDDTTYRRGGDSPDVRNTLLNYGYAILRAVMARSIGAVGLSAVFGVSHVARENSFALADDLMEPVRPFVDRHARDLWLEGATDLGKDERQALAGLLHEDCEVAGARMPLLIGIQRLAQSYAGIVEARRQTLDIPVFPAE